MALSGSFKKNPVSGSYFGLRCEWSGAQSFGKNQTTVTAKVYLDYHTINIGARTVTVKIDGSTYTFASPSINDFSSNSEKSRLLGTASKVVSHSADGTKSGFTISASAPLNVTYSGQYVGTVTTSGTANLRKIPVVKLSLDAGAGSGISVNRIWSAVSSRQGSISNGAYIYNGDNLYVSFGASSGYTLTQHTVNGKTSTASGKTHIIDVGINTKNVSIVSRAQQNSAPPADPKASTISATSAKVGEKSTIRVAKHNTSYYHTITYKFGGLPSKYITSLGGTSSTQTRFKSTTVSFTIPEDFLGQITSGTSRVCTLTCKTYVSFLGAQVGTGQTCTFTVSADSNQLAPTVDGSIATTDSLSNTLTGGRTTIIRNISTTKATITASAKSGASITNRQINGTTISGTTRGFTASAAAGISSYIFKVTDSRGQTAQKTVNVSSRMIDYVPLTFKPDVYKPGDATGEELAIRFTGAMFSGTFRSGNSNYANRVSITYRYRKVGGAYGSTYTINSANISYNPAKNTYSSSGTITVPGTFDYKSDYDFSFTVSEATANGITVRANRSFTITAGRGLPIFDFGEHTFNVNGRLTISEVDIFKLIFPIGAVYSATSSGIPDSVASAGSWSAISPSPLGEGYYSWKRTS